MRATYFKASIFSLSVSAMALVVSSCVLPTGSAQAQNAGYVFSSIGYGYSPEQELDVTITDQTYGAMAARTLDNDWDDVKSFGGGIGFTGLSADLRWELGIEHHADLNLSGFDDTRGHYREAYNATTASVSAYYDLPVQSTYFRPYLGGGLGYSWIVGNGMSASDILGQTEADRQVLEGQTSGDFAWHVGGGVAVPMTRKTSLDLGYRYMNLGSANSADSYHGSIDLASGEADTSGSAQIDPLNLHAHQLKASLRHSLARDENREFRLRDEVSFESSYGMGYGDYELEWRIADDLTAQKDKVTSRIEDLDSMVFMGDWQMAYNGWLVDAKGRFAWILDGDFNTSTSDATGVTSRMSGEAIDDYVYTATVGFGRNFGTDVDTQNALYFRPMIGASVSEQKLRMHEGLIEVGANAGTEQALNSTFESRWMSGWIGGEAEITGPDYRLTLRGEFHKALYDAKAQWSRNFDLEQPVSFTQTTRNANGLSLMARAETDISNATRFYASAEFERWQGYNGDDTNAADPDFQGTLQEVKMQGYSLGAGFVFGL